MVLRRAGCKNEKIVFILDESNILESGFLERMNTLLANGEVSSAFFLFQQPVTMVHYRVVYREDPMHFSHFFKYHSFHYLFLVQVFYCCCYCCYVCYHYTDLAVVDVDVFMSMLMLMLMLRVMLMFLFLLS